MCQSPAIEEAPRIWGASSTISIHFGGDIYLEVNCMTRLLKVILGDISNKEDFLISTIFL